MALLPHVDGDSGIFLVEGIKSALFLFLGKLCRGGVEPAREGVRTGGGRCSVVLVHSMIEIHCSAWRWVHLGCSWRRLPMRTGSILIPPVEIGFGVVLWCVCCVLFVCTPHTCFAYRARSHAIDLNMVSPWRCVNVCVTQTAMTTALKSYVPS